MKKNELKKWRKNYTPFTTLCLGEGLKLNVHFEEKDFVKDNGGRWNPDSSGKGGYWWMPVHMLVHRMGSNVPCIVNIFDPQNESGDTCISKGEGTTMLDWLNDNKMLTSEIHGNLRPDACDAAAQTETGNTYSLSVDRPRGATMAFTFFENLGIVKMTTIQPHGNPSSGPTTRESSNWCSADSARALWNSLVEAGSKRIDKEIAV